MIKMDTISAVVVPVTGYDQNCTLAICNETKKCAVIDPGGDVKRILSRVKLLGLDVEEILITHPHVDHANGAKELKEATGADIVGPHKADNFWIENLMNSSVGIRKENHFVPDRWLEDGDKITVGETTWKALHCPGHTPGSIVYYNKENSFAEVGDVLFKGSVGRSDFPGGNEAELKRSITQKLWPLGDVKFIAGHGWGWGASFDKERTYNPYVADKDLTKRSTRQKIEGLIYRCTP